MNTPPSGIPVVPGPSTSTSPGAQLAIQRDAVTGLRVWGTNVEHDFPPGFDRIWVGKDPQGADVRHVIRIDHPSVSRRHAKIEWRGPHLVVEDQASKNGTSVDGKAQAIFELVPEARVRFGDVVTVAYNERTQRVRAGLRRFLGYGDAAQLAIEQLQYGAANRHAIALVGSSHGSAGQALAKYLHDSMPANAWPYLAPSTLPAADDCAGQRALVASAAYGTLVLDLHKRGTRYERIRHVCEAIATNAYHVRLVVIIKPKVILEHVVGDAVRSAIHVIHLPPLVSRGAEAQRLIEDTIKHHAAQQGAAAQVLDDGDRAEIGARISDPRHRRHIETWQDLEDTIQRLIAIRKGGSARAAELAWGLSPGALAKWAAKYGWSTKRSETAPASSSRAAHRAAAAATPPSTSAIGTPPLETPTPPAPPRR